LDQNICTADGLIVHFGLIPAMIAAALLSKDVGQALKQFVKLLKGDDAG
jgi:hypothetical protein